MLQQSLPLSLLPEEVNYVIYHSPCTDGTGSGLVAFKYFTENYPEKNVIYKPMSIGLPYPDDIFGKNVLICDYSYKKDVLLDLLTKVNKLLIIDHHKSAEKDLADIDPKYKIFDMNHSGAVLTWKYFYPNEKIPLLLEYIEDNDIWKKALPNTDDFRSAIWLIPHEFPEYAKYLDETQLMDLIEVGKSYNQLNDYYAGQALKYVNTSFSKIKGKYYLVGYINTTILKSEIGHKIFTEYPLLDFSSCYSIGNNSTAISLRSTNDRMDVSKIATKFGGGGHRNASGLRLEYVSNILPGKVYDTGQVYDLLNSVYFGNTNGINIVYLHSTFYKHQLGNYLLQTKSKVVNKDSITKIKVANFLEKNIYGTNEIKNYCFSAIWSYNPVTDKSNYVITFDKNLSEDGKNNFIESLTKLKNCNILLHETNFLKVEFDGLIKEIRFNKKTQDMENLEEVQLKTVQDFSVYI